MLNDKTLFGDIKKVDAAIYLLQHMEPEDGYYLAFSGGKDSCVCKALLDMSGVKYDAHYNVTTIDPPELVWFIKQNHSDVIFERPKQPFLKEMIKRGFPQRQRRWCCEFLKERGGSGRLVVTGVRREESARRSQRKCVEHDTKDKNKSYVNILIDWSEDDVWDFIKENKIPYCKLYDEGWKRIGCLLCPISGKMRIYEAKRYPRFTKLFIKSFEDLYKKKKSEGKTSVDRWESGEDMFNWWINENRTSVDPDQGVMFE